MNATFPSKRPMMYSSFTQERHARGAVAAFFP
jgi:hypothetical protein